MGHIHEADPMVPADVLTKTFHSGDGYVEPEYLREKRKEAIAYLRKRGLYVLDRRDVSNNEQSTVLGAHRDQRHS